MTAATPAKNPFALAVLGSAHSLIGVPFPRRIRDPLTLAIQPTRADPPPVAATAGAAKADFVFCRSRSTPATKRATSPTAAPKPECWRRARREGSLRQGERRPPARAPQTRRSRSRRDRAGAPLPADFGLKSRTSTSRIARDLRHAAARQTRSDQRPREKNAPAVHRRSPLLEIRRR